MGIVDTTRDLVLLVQMADNRELTNKVLELQNQLLQLIEHQGEMQEEIERLRRELAPGGMDPALYLTRLNDRMEHGKISQNSLAKEMRLTPSQVSRWFTSNLKRRVMPNMLTMQKIEDALRRLESRRASRYASS